MHIEVELDLVHSERLKTLQVCLNKPLAEVLAIAIDAALSELAPEQALGQSSLYEALESIGFVGCIEDDARLAANYKQRLDFSPKAGQSRGSSSMNRISRRSCPFCNLLDLDAR
jgi:hypothetical protein